MFPSQKSYDVIIIGGGLAGLTLALQLINSNSEISILLLEKRTSKAPEATHKVGESIVELSAHYLRKDLGLKKYLIERHLPKFGFRYFLESSNKEVIDQRLELGSRTTRQAPSHHIDRGILENDLLKLVSNKGVEVIQGSKVIHVEIEKNNHQITIESPEGTIPVHCKWLVDATGRRSILKRKLQLSKNLDHEVNSVWFRIDSKFNPQEWSSCEKWRSQLPPHFRRLSTNHFLGKGYWVWMIPLVKDRTSIGIVANDNAHSFESINTLEKAINWIKTHEPLLGEKIEESRSEVVDFKSMKHFAHDTKQFISKDKWCLTGESGAFLDPFYSPGTDFIALSNSWITDLVIRDLKNEDITFRLNLYEHIQRQLVDGWFSLYRSLYGYLSNTNVMLAKIVWDWSTYWSILTPLFIQKGFINNEVLKAYASSKESIGLRFNMLNENLQKLFVDWSQFDDTQKKSGYVNVFDLAFLYKFHLELKDNLNPEELILRLKQNLKILETVASELFRKAYEIKNGEVYQGSVDPYKADLKKNELNSQVLEIESNASIKDDLDILWTCEGLSMHSEKYGHIAAQKLVEDTFMKSKAIAESGLNNEDLIVQLNKTAEEYMAVAYEGASFAIGLKCLTKGKLDEWFDFIKYSPESNVHHIMIGFGWAFAMLKKAPKQVGKEIDQNLTEMILDGIGYYEALFKTKKTLLQFKAPSFVVDGSDLGCFDHGVGRRIWYYSKGDPTIIKQTINEFPTERRKNLWRGVGLACGYVGNVHSEILWQLQAKSDIYHINLSAGIISSAIYNMKYHRNIEKTLRACRIISGITQDDLAEISNNLKGNFNLSTNRIIKLVESILTN